MWYAILGLALIVMLYMGTFALNRRFPEMEGELDPENFTACINCPSRGSCSVDLHRKFKEDNA
jgi:hypothetical protein